MDTRIAAESFEKELSSDDHWNKGPHLSQMRELKISQEWPQRLREPQYRCKGCGHRAVLEPKVRYTEERRR